MISVFDTHQVPGSTRCGDRGKMCCITTKSFVELEIWLIKLVLVISPLYILENNFQNVEIQSERDSTAVMNILPNNRIERIDVIRL